MTCNVRQCLRPHHNGSDGPKLDNPSAQSLNFGVFDHDVALRPHIFLNLTHLDHLQQKVPFRSFAVMSLGANGCLR
jgi:hypothetical protein